MYPSSFTCNNSKVNKEISDQRILIFAIINFCYGYQCTNIRVIVITMNFIALFGTIFPIDFRDDWNAKSQPTEDNGLDNDKVNTWLYTDQDILQNLPEENTFHCLYMNSKESCWSYLIHTGILYGPLLHRVQKLIHQGRYLLI